MPEPKTAQGPARSAESTIRLSLDRWYLGLHGLALLRSYPYGDLEEAEARMAAMRSLLAKEGEAWLFEAEEFEALDTAEAYERWATTYDEPNPLIVAEERVLLAQLDGRPPGSALDVATGTGRIASLLQKRGHRVSACDRSEAMLGKAAAKLQDVAFFRADLELLPIADDSFNLITCSLALTHVPELLPTFRSFARVLRAGGVAVISDIHPFAVATGAQAFFRLLDNSRAVTRNEQHSISDYVTAAIDAGFEIEACREAFVDQDLLQQFGVSLNWLDPENSILGLPFAVVWVFRLPS